MTSISLNPTNDTLNSLRRVELVASLAVLLAMGVLVMVVVRRGLRPLRLMAGTADAIASGDLARRVPEERPGTEVGRLGVALNEMLAQIEGAFAEKSASEERLRQFVADASHELRTPLTSIRGYAELLGRGGFSDEAGTAQGAEADRGGGDPDGWPGRGPAAARRARPGPAACGRSRSISTASAPTPWATRTRSRTTTDLTLEPGPPVVVLGDSERLAQVAHNLVRNALAHTPEGTEVTVSTGVAGTMGYIQVSDNGPGIPPAEVSRVFDRFYQGDPSRSVSGTGLGLAIVRAIAEALHGTAEVRSTPGGGATLIVRIPLAATHVAATAEPSPCRSAHRSCTEEPGTTASRTVASLTSVSAASAAGSEPATMPAPARSVTDASSSCRHALRMPIIHSPSPPAPGPADRPGPVAPLAGLASRDEGERLGTRGAADGRGGMEPLEEIEHADAVGPTGLRSSCPGGPRSGRPRARAPRAPRAPCTDGARVAAISSTT